MGAVVNPASTIEESQINDGSILARVASVETVTGLWTFNRGAAAPFAVDASSLVVANLDSDLLDGQEGSFYQDAGNLNAGVLLDARVQESNVTQHEAALTILETQITDGSILARVAGTETITGAWTFNSTVTQAANQTDGFIRYQKIQWPSGTGTAGNWYRVAQRTGGQGRGYGRIIITGNSSAAGFQTQDIQWYTDANGAANIHQLAGAWAGKIRAVRSVRNSGLGETYFDIQLDQTVSTDLRVVLVNMEALGGNAMTSVNFTDVTSLPGGDVVDKTFNIIDGSLHRIYGFAANSSDTFYIDEIGRIVLGAGSDPANPPITFSGDTDTGFLRDGANRVAIVTGGVIRNITSATGRFHILNTSGTDLANDECALLLGTAGATHLELAQTQIQAKTDTTTAGPLSIQGSGGTTTFGDDVIIPLGSQASPSLTFSGDTDTGIYSPAANELGLVTGGVRRLHILSDGSITQAANTPQGFVRFEKNDKPDSTGSAGDWFRVAERVGANGRGYAQIVLTGSGGISVPTGIVLHWYSDWTGNQNIQLVSAPYKSDFRAVRATYDSAAQTSSLDVQIDTTVDTNLRAVIYNDEAMGSYTTDSVAWTNVTSLPGGDTIQAILTIQNGSNVHRVLGFATQGLDDALFISADGRIAANTGASTDPSYKFVDDEDTGMYRSGTDTISFAAAGVERFRITSTAVSVRSAIPLLLQDGAIGSPSLGFVSDTDTGMYRVGSDWIGFSTGGTIALQISSNQQVLAEDGAAGSCSYSWRLDTDSGLFRNGANDWQLSAGGVGQQTVDTSGVEMMTGFRVQRRTANFAGTQHNYTGMATGSHYELTGSVTPIITGITGGVDGKFLWIRNAGATAIVFNHQDTNSSPANRIRSYTGANITVNQYNWILLVHNGTEWGLVHRST